MKKVVFIVSLLVLFTACETSQKGAWSEEDKAMAQAEMDKIEGELDELGELKQPYIDCYLEKVEANFSSFYAADSDVEGCEKLAEECANEIMSSLIE